MDTDNADRKGPCADNTISQGLTVNTLSLSTKPPEQFLQQINITPMKVRKIYSFIRLIDVSKNLTSKKFQNFEAQEIIDKQERKERKKGGAILFGNNSFFVDLSLMCFSFLVFVFVGCKAG